MSVYQVSGISRLKIIEIIGNLHSIPKGYFVWEKNKCSDGLGQVADCSRFHTS